MKKHEIITAVAEKEIFYHDLVSYARKTEEQYNTYPLVKELIDRLETEFPTETEKLKGEEGDWTHGFNSGMLACLRLLGTGKMTMQKIVEFPELDT